MKIILNKITINVIALLIFFLPFLIFADSSLTIQNPLGENNTSVQALMQEIMKLVGTAGAVVVVLFIIYSGYKFVSARGNPEGIKKAKETFFATIIGAAILLGAGIIANVVVGTVKTLK
jgi:heme/copper-type cytochrome/quinol oxidase subunit 2